MLHRREIEIPDLSQASLSEIGDVRGIVDTQAGLFGVRLEKVRALIASGAITDDRIVKTMEEGLEREKADVVKLRKAFEASIPREQLGEEVDSLQDRLGEVAIRESALLGVTEEPTEWLAVLRAFGEDAPGETYDVFADRIETGFDKLSKERKGLEGQLLAHEAIIAAWTPLPDIVDRKTPVFEVRDESVVTFDSPVKMETVGAQRVREHTLRRIDKERRDQLNEASRIAIQTLINNPDEWYTYQDIATVLYADKPTKSRYDSRPGSLFRNNLNPTHGKGNHGSTVFREELGDDWLLVKGKRVPIDPETGKSAKYKTPEVCYKVIPRAKAESNAA